MRAFCVALASLMGVSAYSLIMCGIYYSEEKLGLMGVVTAIVGAFIALGSVAP